MRSLRNLKRNRSQRKRRQEKNDNPRPAGDIPQPTATNEPEDPAYITISSTDSSSGSSDASESSSSADTSVSEWTEGSAVANRKRRRIRKAPDHPNIVTEHIDTSPRRRSRKRREKGTTASPSSKNISSNPQKRDAQPRLQIGEHQTARDKLVSDGVILRLNPTTYVVQGVDSLGRLLPGYVHLYRAPNGSFTCSCKARTNCIHCKVVVDIAQHIPPMFGSLMYTPTCIPLPNFEGLNDATFSVMNDDDRRRTEVRLRNNIF